jgi:hypothetical protein
MATRKRTGTRTINRSSVTGKFVKPGYAKTHRRTTDTEHRPIRGGGSRKKR